MNGLYPLKFNPIFLKKIWGNGKRLEKLLEKNLNNFPDCGESWELSTTEGHFSEVRNGFLAGNNLSELIEVYMGDLVGDRIYDKFGLDFPLLFKFIDTGDDLSIQVHPGDETALMRHNAYGKTEMWYVVDAGEGALINLGFNRDVTRDQYLKYLEDAALPEILYYGEVSAGDVLFIPPGRVHAIGKGILLAEIQQASDLTYRIFDYNRKDEQGNLRELHNHYAVDIIDFKKTEKFTIDYTPEDNTPSELISCNYFTVNLIVLSKPIERDNNKIDSFVVYMTIKGKFIIEYEGGTVEVSTGETVLIPASLEYIRLTPLTEGVKILETYIP